MADGPDWDTRHLDGRETPRFLYHCIIQSPVEPLTTYELCITGPDQSQGQAGLTEAVFIAFQHFSGTPLTRKDHLCYVAFAVHPDGSEHWEACKRCNELIDHEHEEAMQYTFEEFNESSPEKVEERVRVYHDEGGGPDEPTRIA